jgi:hypothetical protein
MPLGAAEQNSNEGTEEAANGWGRQQLRRQWDNRLTKRSDFRPAIVGLLRAELPAGQSGVFGTGALRSLWTAKNRQLPSIFPRATVDP